MISKQAVLDAALLLLRGGGGGRQRPQLHLSDGSVGTSDGNNDGLTRSGSLKDGGRAAGVESHECGRLGELDRRFSAGCAEDIAEWTTGPNSSITHAKGLASSEYGMSRKPLHLSYDERPLRKGMRPNGPKSAKSTVGGERQPLKGRDEAREMDTNQQLHW